MSLEVKIREKIKAELMKVTAENSPNVYDYIHNSKGQIDTAMYNRMENKIVNKMVQGKLSVEAAIPQVENEMELL
jgi:hypothetical protein